ncbi:YdbH domain-containing protein [Shewanella sp. AS1]|uniref:YdbH domain-containing protein n=1 Tax=Shewanella sp. AS1 TaxID=2907626 RepID=UPI001F2E5508|nr:YdbH domain-containing protein [Shewanella sp. AS1]MCE9678585.1 YdbH domain-containing protein [Shewanella sp. AS1]
MARLSKTSRMIGIILLLSLAGAALFVAITWSQFSNITTAGANQFLKDHHTQITSLSITPQALLRGQVGAITLDVDGTIITIEQLQVSLKEDLSWWSFSLEKTLSLASIKSVAVDNIDIRLSPKLLQLGALSAPKAQDKKPTEAKPTETKLTETKLTEFKIKNELVSTLASLPLIAVGRAQIHLTNLEDKQTSLVLNYLNLDQRGHLLGHLSVNEQKLIDIQASLGEEIWQGKTRLELRPLYALAAHLSELNQDNTGADTLNRIRQLVTESQLHFAGHLDSTWAFHLQDHRLSSTHKVQQLDLNLGSISLGKRNQASLSQPVGIELRSKAVDNLAPNRTSVVNEAQNSNLEFTLSGPLSDLALQLSPFALETKLSTAQLDGLFTPLEPQHWPLKTDFRPAPQEEVKVSLTLNHPLDYHLKEQALKLPQAKAQISLAEHRLTAEVKELTLTPKTLTTRWRLNGSVLIPLCMPQLSNTQLSSNTQPTPAASRCDGDFKDKIKNKIKSRASLNGIDLSLSGEAEIKSEPLQMASNFSMDAQSRVTLLSPSYQQQTLALSAEEIALMLQAPLTLKDMKQLNFGQSRLTVRGNRLALTAPQPQPPIKISSQQTQLQLSGGSLRWKKERGQEESLTTQEAKNDAKQEAALQLLLELEPFSVTTEQPQLKDGARELSALQLKMQSKANLNLAIEQDVKFRVPGIQLDLTQFELIDPIDAAANAETAQVTQSAQTTQTAQKEKSQQNQPKASKRITQIASFTLTSQAFRPKPEQKPKSEPEQKSKHTEASLYTLQSPLKTTLQYRLHHLQSREQYQWLGKQRSRKLLEISEFSLRQSLNWQADNKAKDHRLSTNESWQLQDINFTSEHKLTLQKAKAKSEKQRLKLQGKLKLTSDINQLLREFEQMLDLKLPLNGVGDIQLSTTHNANWTDSGITLGASLVPELEFTQGELKQLPFQQVWLTGACHLAARLDNQNQGQYQQAEFICDRLQLKIAAFNPGVLLTDIEAMSRLEFAIEQASSDSNEDNDGNELNGNTQKQTASLTLTANASTLGGKLLLPKFNLHLTRPSEAYLILQGLDLTQLLAVQPLTGVYADGIFDGVLPVELEHGQISVNQGHLAARAPGGLIKVDDNPAVMQMRQTQPYLDYAFSILEELHYSELASEFDMAPNGDAKLRVMVKGRAKDIERPIHFNYTQEENMLQLLKSLQIGDSLQNKIEQAMEQ